MFKLTLVKTVRGVAVGLGIGFASSAIAAPSLIAMETGGGTQVSESGVLDYYTLKLSEPPAANVTVSFVLDGQLLVNPRVVTLTPANYATGVVVTVSAVDDKTPEGDHTGKIGHNLTSQAPELNQLNQAEVTVAITDNDLAAVNISKSAATVTEGEPPESYTVALSVRPAADVTIGIRRVGADGQQPGPAAASAQLLVSPASITFKPNDWGPRTVTLTAVNDAKADGSLVETIMHTVTSLDTAYTAYSLGTGLGKVEVTVLDDDSPGVLKNKSAIRVIEGGKGGAYFLRLATEPETSVSVTVVAADESHAEDARQVTVVPPRVTFSPTNWNTPQTITVNAVDDSIGEGVHTVNLNHFVSSTDPVYLDQKLAPVTITVIDNDVPAVLVDESGESTRVAEGGSPDSYTLVLTTKPADTVAVEMHAGSQLEITPQRVVFTPENFSVLQTVTVRAHNDKVVEETMMETIRHSIESADYGYGSFATVDDVVVTITDDDVRGVLLSRPSLQLNEGGNPGTYSVSLMAQPTSDVVVEILAEASLGVSAAEIVFTPEDFSTPKVINVSVADDDVAQGPRMASIQHSARSEDGGYDGMAIGSISVSIADDDVPALLLEETQGATGVTEGDVSGDSYTVRLATRPQSSVVVRIDAGNQLRVEPAELRFSSDDSYSVPQTVVVIAVDDSTAEGMHVGTIRHSIESVDEVYEKLPPSDLTVSIVDNDAAALLLEETGGSTRVVEGAVSGDRYSLRLASRPQADVVVEVDAGDQLTVEPTVLTFTADNYDVAQNVTVRAVDDTVVEGQHIGTIFHRAQSGDRAYGEELPMPELTVVIDDNDKAVNPSKGKTSSGSLDSLSLLLLGFGGLVGLCRVARRWNLG